MSAHLPSFYALFARKPNTYIWDVLERGLIQATLDFANMSGVPSAHGVEDLFRPFSRSMWVPVRTRKAKPLLKTVRTRRQAILLSQVIQSRTISTHRRHQLELRYALSLIVDEKSIAKFADRLSYRLEAIPFQLGFVGGSLAYRFSIKSVAAGWALGLVALIDGDYALRSCEECARYFTIFDAKKHRQRYCEECAADARRESAAARQRRWRQKQRR